ncbi:MAG: hypothetical protein ABSE62_09895 [Chthoniobacteraceae bacterium]|jgi:hypothetical protein
MKNLKPIIAASLVALFTSAHAFARIGETPDQIATRYGVGQPSSARFPGTTQIKYFKGGYEIDVHFLNGKSIAEQFKNPPVHHGPKKKLEIF